MICARLRRVDFGRLLPFCCPRPPRGPFGAAVGESVVIARAEARTVVWCVQSFPPHWVGTTIRLEDDSTGRRLRVGLRHDGFTGEEEAGRLAYTWGQITVRLKEAPETRERDPVSL